MTNRHRPNGFRPRLETLEAREVPATPVQIGATGVTLSGALSSWDYSDGGSFTPSPVFADVDGNGSEELISVTGDRKVAAYTSGGGAAINLLRTYDTGAAAEVFTTPLVLTIPGIGKAIFVGDRNGMLYGWNAATGAMLPGFPTTVVDVPDDLYPQGGERNSILGPLAGGDLDGDGVPEIVVTSYNQHVSAIKTNGTLLWRYANDDSVLSGVAIGDLDRDGVSDVVIGGDYSQNANYDAGGNITVLSGPTGRRKWIKQLPQIAQSSPVLADINNDGQLEIFIGTGINFTNLNGQPFPGNAVYGVDAYGNDLAGWPYLTTGGNANVEGRTPSPPALADVTGDGIPEVIIGDYAGKLHVIRANGAPLWTAQPSYSGAATRLSAAPVVLDIDGDNDLDVVQIANGEIRAFDGFTGATTWSGFIEDGNTRQLITTPAVGRFRGNGSVQLAVLSNGNSQPNGQPRSPSFVRFFDVDPSTKTPQWWASRGDASGNVVRRTPAFADSFLVGLATYLGRDATGTASLQNDWRAIAQTAPNLEVLTRNVAVTNEGRTNEIRRWYTTYLDRSPDQAGVDGWLTYLAPGVTTFSQVEALFLGSVEAFFLSGPTGQASATNQTWVNYMYQRVLGRGPQNGEEGPWVNLINSGSVQRTDVSFAILRSQEATERRVRRWYGQFAFGGSTTPPPASVHAAGWDLRRGLHEESVFLRLYGNGYINGSSDFLSTTTEGSWLKAVYRDVLKREAAPAELIGWMQNLEAGGNLDGIGRALINSVERNVQLMNSYFRRYLNRAVDPSQAEVIGFAQQLSAGTTTREQVITYLMSTNEYANLSGNTGVGYVNAVWAHILGPGRTPDQASLNYWSTYANAKAELPIALMKTDEYLFNTIRNDWMGVYLRRYPNTASNQSALFFQPSPDPFAPIRSYIEHMKAALGRQQDVEAAILTSAEYILIARYSAFWTGKRWKI